MTFSVEKELVVNKKCNKSFYCDFNSIVLYFMVESTFFVVYLIVILGTNLTKFDT